MGGLYAVSDVLWENVRFTYYAFHSVSGKAELYIILALLIGMATVIVGCWLSDNCWSPEPEQHYTIAWHDRHRWIWSNRRPRYVLDRTIYVTRLSRRRYNDYGFRRLVWRFRRVGAMRAQIVNHTFTAVYPSRFQ